MKNFILLLIAFCSFAVLTHTESQAQSWTDYKVMVSADSINDIAGTDSTISYAIRHNADWSITIHTGTISGSGGSFNIQASNDGTNYFNYPATDSTYIDTIASNTNYTYTSTSLPFRYIAIKTTKGTCEGLFSASFYMKPQE